MLVVTVKSRVTGSTSPERVTAACVTVRPVLEVALLMTTATASVLVPSASLASKSVWATDLSTVHVEDAFCPGSITPIARQLAKLIVVSLLPRVTVVRPTVPVFETETAQ
jgi:hypothetical protein